MFSKYKLHVTFNIIFSTRHDICNTMTYNNYHLKSYRGKNREAKSQHVDWFLGTRHPNFEAFSYFPRSWKRNICVLFHCASRYKARLNFSTKIMTRSMERLRHYVKNTRPGNSTRVLQRNSACCRFFTRK